MTRARILKVGAACALVIGLAACGGDDDNAASSGGGGSAPVGTASVPASALTVSGFIEYFNNLVSAGAALDREEARLLPAGVAAETDDRGEARLLN